MNTKRTNFYRACAAVLTAGAGLLALPLGASAQTNVWHDDFDQNTVGANSTDGSYGRIAYNFSGAGVGSPIVIITNSTPDSLPGDPSYTHTNYAAFIFTSANTAPPLPLNFGWDINSIATTGGNTNTSLRAYTLSFDLAVKGDGINNLGGYVGPICYLFGQSAAGSYSSGEYYGNGAQTNISAGFFPAPSAGWVHYVMPLGSFGTANAGALNPTDPAFSFGFGAYMAGLAVTNNEEIDVANVELTMSAPPPIAPPTLAIVPAKPGLRIFAQDHTATYNQEGFGTVDPNQSWVGVATKSQPVSYQITFQDFNTAANYQMNVQFAPGAASGNPYGVYQGNNDFLWTITSHGGASGFTTAIAFKTNSPANVNGAETNVVLAPLTTTSTNGVGTWTLTFTSDTNGTVIAPDGTTESFVLDPNAAAQFANPVTILFGTDPNNVAGYGQFTDLGRLNITNVVDGTEFDDFTQDATLNTSLWNPGFSLNAGSVIQVSTDTPYWVNWTIPDEGFGLGTEPDLNNASIPLSTPNYYGAATGVTITGPTQMGLSLKWALIPTECLPTVDGTQGGTTSTGQGFFQLSSPAPAQ
jgi:hypothetical protein